MGNTNPQSAASDPRAARAQAWAQSTLQLAAADWGIASADASFRRYFRLRSGADSWIVMDAPPERESSDAFVAIAELLARWGLHVPKVLAWDRAEGFLLLSDMGASTYLEQLTPENADTRMAAALDALLQMQKQAATDVGALTALPRYDAALLQRELQLFVDWYVPRICGASLQQEFVADWNTTCATLLRSAEAQPQTFVHRDFMFRNLMDSAPQPGVLDFQDAVAGPWSYDLLSLFKDAFISWPPERIEAWARDFQKRALEAGLPVPADWREFRRCMDWMGVQRHLKVLGIFARLDVRDGKPRYFADTPRFVRYIMDVVPHYPELRGLQNLFESVVLPQMESR